MIKYQGLSTLEILKEAENYNKWIADSILTHITTPVLEIGAGTGNLTKHFLTKRPLYITDSDTGLVKNLQQQFQKEKDISAKLFDVTKKPPREFNSFFNTVFGINVLEHINNDEKALQNIKSVLKPNGTLILLVPAKKKAYTKLDKELGHFRRYEKEELLTKLTQNGYKVDKLYYFNIVGLMSWYIRDKVNKNNINLKPYHITIFDSVVPTLRVIESIIEVPMGISLIAVARNIAPQKR